VLPELVALPLLSLLADSAPCSAAAAAAIAAGRRRALATSPRTAEAAEPVDTARLTPSTSMRSRAASEVGMAVSTRDEEAPPSAEPRAPSGGAEARAPAGRLPSDTPTKVNSLAGTSPGRPVAVVPEDAESGAGGVIVTAVDGASEKTAPTVSCC